MKKEYDFSKGKRGKFYRRDAELYLPDMGSQKTDYLEIKERIFGNKTAKTLYDEITGRKKNQ